jgi:hypothetical protein
MLRDRDGGLVVNDEEQFRHLIESVHAAEKVWSERTDGYLSFFHILVPTQSRSGAIKDVPQLKRAIVYHFQSHKDKSKTVKWVASFPSGSAVGPAAQYGSLFRGKVEEVLVQQHGFTIVQTLAALVQSRINHLERHPLPVS